MRCIFMKKSKGTRAIEQLALQKGISIAEIREEIEIAINAAMTNPDPAAKKFWSEIMKNAKKPTPEELIEYLSGKVLS